jgi:hypothetical protein
VRVPFLVILVVSLGLATTSTRFDLFNILGLPDIFEDNLSGTSPQVQV